MNGAESLTSCGPDTLTCDPVRPVRTGYGTLALKDLTNKEGNTLLDTPPLKHRTDARLES